MTQTTIALEPELSAAEFIDVLMRSTLHLRRPVNDLPRIEAMLRNADIIVTARDQGNELVGVARAISDFAYCTYLSDLAVAQSHQRTGIGRQLIAAVQQAAGDTASLILLSAPAAVEYYPKIGMRHHPACWTFPPISPAAISPAAISPPPGSPPADSH